MSVVQVGEIASQIRGVTYAKSDIADGPKDGFTAVLRANNITEEGLYFSDLVHVRSKCVATKQMLRMGDILIAASSGSLSVVGKAAQAEADHEMGFGAFCKVVRPGPRVDPRYLGHFFRTGDYRRKISSLAAGANINNLKSEHIDELKIPLPPLPEQRRIAGILDQADALRRLRRVSLARLSDLSQAIFYEMFGDPITNPKSLPTVKLSELGSLDRGVSKHRPRNEPALLGGSHPLIQTGDVSRASDYINRHSSTYSDAGLRQSKMWPKGTLCITIAANIADTAILNFDSCFPDSVVGFNGHSEILNFFVHCWFKLTKGELERLAPAVAQKNINLAILRELDIIKPSHEDLLEYNKRMQVLGKQTEYMSDELATLNSLFASLQHRAFRGEL